MSFQEITTEVLQALRKNVKFLSEEALKNYNNPLKPLFYDDRATTLTSVYGLMRNMPKARKWIGERKIHTIGEKAFEITVDDFELTVGVKRTQILDNNLSQVRIDANIMGQSAGQLPFDSAVELLVGAFSNIGPDGVVFCSDEHTRLLPNGKEAKWSNSMGGTGRKWFLIDNSKVLKPFIQLTRQDWRFIAKDKDDDDNVFMKNEYIYGLDGRFAFGYFIPQTICGSRQELNSESFQATKLKMRNLLLDHDVRANIVPDTIVVGPELEASAVNLFTLAKLANGADNPLYGAVKIIVAQGL